MSSKIDNSDGDIIVVLERVPGYGKFRGRIKRRSRISTIRPHRKTETIPDRLNIPKTPKNKV